MDRPSATAPEYWGRQAVEYDDLIRRIVPRYEEMGDRLVASLPEQAGHVLELGCGTGSLSVRLVSAFPMASFTFVDAAPEMLAVARSRIAAVAPAAAERATYVEARFEDLEGDADAWDLIVASLSLHHVADPLPVYRTLVASCAAGGALRMADGLRAAKDAHHDAHMNDWRAYWSGPGGLTPDETESVLDHIARHDHYFTLEQHFEWLRAAGFGACDCLWRSGLFGVISADRPD